MIRKSHFIIYVRDQQASADFYAQALGQKPSLHVPGMTEFELSSGAVLGLMPETGIQRLLGPLEGDPPQQGSILKAELYLVVDDAAAAHACALKAGGRELSGLAERDWGDRAAYCLDPDGYVLAFAERGEQ